MTPLSAETIAHQLASAQRAVEARGCPPRGGLGSWRVLLALAEAAPTDEHAALAPLVERAGTKNGDVEPRCLAGASRLLPEAEASARIRAALLGTPDSDLDALGALLAALPAPERSAMLPAHLERALALPEDTARWEACDALTLCLDHEESRRWERWFGEACLRRFGAISDDPYRWLDATPTPAQKARTLELERSRWGATFEAWRLGDEATSLPEPAQGPALDRAIDAFEEIVATPVDPGNDEGPFWAIARYLSLPQVHRALAILGRMKASDWCYELAASKAALLTRLAWLGQRDEALVVLQSIGTVGDFDAHWRATAWGGLVSGRLANEPGLTLTHALRDAEAIDARTLLDHEGRFRILSELFYRLQTHSRPPPAATAEECIAEVLALQRRDARLGRIAMEACIGACALSLPTERWLALLAAEEDGLMRLELLEALFESEREGARAPQLALAGLLLELQRTPPPHPEQMVRLLFDERALLTPADLLPVWERWLALATQTDAGFLSSLRELEESLGGLVAFLGGPDAPAAACRALSAIHDV